MPKITLMPSGIKASVPTGCAHGGGQRDICNGWSLSSGRRNDLFLRSVDPAKLDGIGFAFSLTVRTCPPSHREWERMRQAFVHRLRRCGLIRLHWLTEWQPRSYATGGPAPHFHAVAFFDRARLSAVTRPCFAALHLERHWLEVSAQTGALSGGQTVKVVSDVQGWFGYLAKHGARGVFHYQRQRGTLPIGWQQTGRMWGKSGNWPISEREMDCTPAAFYALRRMVDRLLIVQAEAELRAARDPAKLEAARKRLAYLKDPRKRLRSDLADLPPIERVRLLKAIGRVGSVSEWCDPGLILRWLHACCDVSEVMDQDTGEMRPHWRLKRDAAPSSSLSAKRFRQFLTSQRRA